MGKKEADLRKTLSLNIKKQRELLGISQEKLAESAGISSNMIKDIEGCRSWVSDKTLIKLAAALKTDIYRLFVPATIYEEDMYKTVLNDLFQILHKMKRDINSDFEKALKLWGLKEQK
jgi:transcriptional regulator with XRE-family HTH domain